jgi:site-specific recombinase XerD
VVEAWRWADSSPLRGLHKLNVKEDPRHVRRALSVEDLRRLLRATAEGPERFGMSGFERHLLYRFVIETALRRGEVARLRVADFDFTAQTVSVRAARGSKAKKTKLQAISPNLCDELKAFMSNRLPSAKAFGGSFVRLTAKTSKMLQQDLEACGLCYRDELGSVFDFHALRGQAASLLLATGANPKTVQSVLRHADIGMTMNVYAKLLPQAEREAVERLPDFSLPERRAMSPTGTDEILPISYRQDGQMRKPVEASGSVTVNSGSEPSIPDNERGLSRSRSLGAYDAPVGVSRHQTGKAMTEAICLNADLQIGPPGAPSQQNGLIPRFARRTPS